MENIEAIYCGGKFLKTVKSIDVRSAYDNSLVGSCFLASEAELEQAIVAGQKAAQILKESTSMERAAWLNAIAAGILRNRDHIARVLSREACKPLRLALVETDRAAQVFSVAAEETKRIPSEILSLDWTLAGKGKEGIVKYFPVGLVAGISPFNFPLNLTAHKIAPALAASCPIILKPATRTPLTTLELAKVIDESGLPKGCVSIMPMDRRCGNLLVTDERFKLLSFTGSPAVGWKMKSDAGKKKVVLELGGNAGLIVTEDCDLATTVKKCIVGAFTYAGQVCIHTQRIYVHASIFEAFIEELTRQTQSMKRGAPDDPDTEISAMIDENNAIRVEQWVKDAVNAGAKLLCGGTRKGAFVEPAILTNTRPDMNVSCCEIFGPVVSVEPYTDFEKAVEMVNSSEFGLQAGVFTSNLHKADYAFRNLEVGGVMINEVPTFRIDHMPYGGVKNSGLGREGVRYAMIEMMEPRIMVK